ncbi:hypothetical protein [Mycobacteroides abscessus]|nr:hypothetical protein [Mycobacteroides abscessus]EIU48500.1 hypothetical protein MA6G0125S_1131 [Mycobacteroides abscessus 6G-0125-S]EIU50884.1 hypothetical protein MA6G0125R_0160 [Mycobacteroides abscessus 6G-0125-R]EIU56432.1 hypothetical protein MA6G0728S_1458 [Mycobacteroides abscessus 6G-0728-S]EIU66189.1 hypothetical protein MA6G1108_1117 [Mycobacteroides abscessus 6G-1108]EIU97798.1 hypothetical protein MA6G0212_1188 [Mycobacteroides abscessus 6G-0212]EIV00728.1 hypothetical protein 
MCALLVTSCTHEKPKQPALTWENKDRTTMRWIPNPVADLMFPEGTFVRAITESFTAAQSGPGRGIDAIRAVGYPGFDHAFNNGWDLDFFGESQGFDYLYPNLVENVGTDYAEIVELRQDGDQFTAGVCGYGSLTAGKMTDGTYHSGGSQSLGHAQWLIFGPDPKLPAGQQHPPLANQRGPAKRPTDNVFGTWVLTCIDFAATDLPQCKKLAPGIPNNWPKPYVRPDPPLTLPNDPGWPEGSSA